MQSVTVADRLIDQFELIKVYDEEFRFEARRELDKNTRIAVGKKDGLISRRGRRPQTRSAPPTWPTPMSRNCAA